MTTTSLQRSAGIRPPIRLQPGIRDLAAERTQRDGVRWTLPFVMLLGLAAALPLAVPLSLGPLDLVHLGVLAVILTTAVLRVAGGLLPWRGHPSAIWLGLLLLVALLIFTAGAGVSVYEGILHMMEPEMLHSPAINFAVLGVSFVIEGGSTFFALREFRRTKRPDESFWKALRSSKDPSIFVVLFENCAALVGLAIAAAFIGLTIVTGNPVWDGAGSVLIGLLLAGVAIVLASANDSSCVA